MTLSFWERRLSWLKSRRRSTFKWRNVLFLWVLPRFFLFLSYTCFLFFWLFRFQKWSWSIIVIPKGSWLMCGLCLKWGTVVFSSFWFFHLLINTWPLVYFRSSISHPRYNSFILIWWSYFVWLCYAVSSVWSLRLLRWAYIIIKRLIK